MAVRRACIRLSRAVLAGVWGLRWAALPAVVGVAIVCAIIEVGDSLSRYEPDSRPLASAPEGVLDISERPNVRRLAGSRPFVPRRVFSAAPPRIYHGVRNDDTKTSTGLVPRGYRADWIRPTGGR